MFNRKVWFRHVDEKISSNHNRPFDVYLFFIWNQIDIGFVAENFSNAKRSPPTMESLQRIFNDKPIVWGATVLVVVIILVVCVCRMKSMIISNCPYWSNPYANLVKSGFFSNWLILDLDHVAYNPSVSTGQSESNWYVPWEFKVFMCQIEAWGIYIYTMKPISKSLKKSKSRFELNTSKPLLIAK